MGIPAGKSYMTVIPSPNYGKRAEIVVTTPARNHRWFSSTADAWEYLKSVYGTADKAREQTVPGFWSNPDGRFLTEAEVWKELGYEL